MSANKYNKPNDIAAMMHVSESEIALLDANYSCSWYTTNKTRLNCLLFDLGLDVNRGYTLQDSSLHVNRMGDHTTCQRYYGHERIDKTWLESGYASQAAVDKAWGSKLLENIYSSRKETERAQADLEYHDMFRDAGEA